MSGIYLDNNATTAMDERVVQDTLAAMRERFGNPASPHGFGEEALREVNDDGVLKSMSC